ncbi:MAG: sigma-70 family RNA polymerase sigma factor [Lachnospiraceae bacterium]|nr:sigma-70 family RNA polymerase sigma factor [Lachnospiraceae bacterium]
MNTNEFEQFIQDNGKDILRFCRMTCGDKESGDELYQDTMLKLLEKKEHLDFRQNIKSYALSISMLLWKNKRKKYANRKRLVPTESIDRMEEENNLTIKDLTVNSPENYMIQTDISNAVQRIVANLPEMYRMPIHLYYSANMPVQEIAQVLHIPEGTVKSRMNKARRLLKIELEVLGYDR